MRAMKAIGVLAVALLVGAGSPLPERVITGDGVVNAQVNGIPARIRLDPGAMTIPMISTELADRAKLHTGSSLARQEFGFGIGPIHFMSSTAVGRLAPGSAPFARRIAWNARRYYADVDGVVGPAAMADPVVRFQLRARLSGESTATLPLVELSLFGF